MTETLMLSQQVKRKLNITWSDIDTDARVSDIVASAGEVMLYKLGITDPAFDFSASGIENVLFLAYCLYLYNHCENEFDENYMGLILQARAKHETSEVVTDDE